MTTTPQVQTTTSNLSKVLEEHVTRTKQTTKLPAPHVVIVGPSGSGKSRSIKSLPPEKTLVLNIENKILPFVNHEDFKNQAMNFSTAHEVDNMIKNIKDDPSIKYVVMDSLTKYLELQMLFARSTNKGFDIFNAYNSAVSNFLEALKKCTGKIFLLISIDELVKVEQDSGAVTNRRYITTEGKVHLGKIEKEFAIVLFSTAKATPGSNPPKIEYQFITNTDGITSAKSPEDMFPYSIPNDMGLVVKKVEEYFKLSQ